MQVKNPTFIDFKCPGKKEFQLIFKTSKKKIVFLLLPRELITLEPWLSMIGYLYAPYLVLSENLLSAFLIAWLG